MDESALLEELQRLIDPDKEDGDGLSTAEWADRWNMGKERARGLIGAGLNAGFFILNHRRIKTIDGRENRIPVYEVLHDGNEEEAEAEVG